jgi:putative membrane-bound dehydrogenase-like protein
MLMTHRPRTSFLALLTSCLMVSQLAAQGFSPRDALARMRVPDDLKVELIASEPDIRQPVSISFDDRGRLWVLQYLQYPTPAGLKAVKVDQYLRTVWDKLPDPPPRGPRGADCLTILAPDVQGHYHKVKDFVTGLNLASGFAIGHGGVFVAQPPYLLFYPDRDGNDVPDGDPEVLLTGFGMEDPHAYANSLQWGPDGWLYGAHGSTCTANIRGISFQQGIWRYHPRTRQFELFAEGGGNTWGLDFDSHGNAIAGTNYGDVIGLHQVQGGYYVKGFAKHGELHNPFAFGYFEHMPHKGFKGGHVTCGGIVYQGDGLPARFRNTYIAANPLANNLYWHTLTPRGSTFSSQQGGDFLVSNDTWFRPVDCLTGPDGALYIADWYDKRLNHVDPVDNWDRSNGRIYRVSGPAARTPALIDLANYSSSELVNMLGHGNSWQAGEARRLLWERHDPAAVPLLREHALSEKNPLALPSLWVLAASNELTPALARQLLQHPQIDVRAWTVRLLGDSHRIPDEVWPVLLDMGCTESSDRVRCQLASTCKRLSGDQALPLFERLVRHTEDAKDPFIPMLLWWALEDKAAASRDQVLALFRNPDFWRLDIIKRTILDRLGRRYLAAGAPADQEACATLIRLAPGDTELDRLVAGLEKALEGRALTRPAPGLVAAVNDSWKRQPRNLPRWQLAMRLGNQDAIARAKQQAANKKASAAERTSLVACLGQIHPEGIIDLLVSLVEPGEPADVEQASLGALQGYADPAIADRLLAKYRSLPGGIRTRTQQYLASRVTSARRLLAQVDSGSIGAKEIPVDVIRRMAQFDDPALKELIRKHWGRIEPLTLGEKTARINSVKHMLGSGKGDPGKGHAHFQKLCATCHTLFAEGNKVGPELTGADRRDVDFLTTSIVDPSAVVRNEFVAQVATLNDGRLLTGLLAESGPATVTLLDAKNERLVLPRTNIESLTPSRQSLMPEKLLDELDDQQIRDLFAYLQSNALSSAPQPAAKAKPSGVGAPIKICLISGSLEYDSDTSLAAFQEFLEGNYPVQCTRAFRKSDTDIPGLEALDTCDVAIFFTRRLKLEGKQLERIKKYCASGKPIIGIRTASHGFQTWLDMDRKVLGGNYQGHYGETGTTVAIAPGAHGDPILKGVRPFDSAGSLYRNTGLARDAHVLLTGAIPGHTEPIAWTRLNHGGRVFYTSLGHQNDFKNANFRQLLVNAIYWTLDREPPTPTAGHGPELTLHRQEIARQPDGRVEWKSIVEPTPIDWNHTAIIICDMWDKHWSQGATGRVDKLAPRVNKFIQTARNAGATIIHAPSETMPFYADAPARQRALAAKRAPMPPARKHDDPPQPVDSSDGGSDTGEPKWYKAWNRQHPAIKIDQTRDFISDDGQEVWNVLKERDIRQVLILGVHTNMCVLNRTFAIKSLVGRGMPVALVRDLTDSMYNPQRSPYVSHEEGTRLIIDYIEKFWCPTVTSQEVTAAIKAEK